MRENRDPIDTAAIPWQSINNDVSFKLLNGSREQGPHTMLLRSEPRNPNPPRGQYHPANEEFFCLGGDFTFDGSTWFKKGSYVFYPAYFVHGAQVNVRGGYELYLRISDTSKIIWEETPRTNTPYPANGYDTDDYAVQLTATTELDHDATSPAINRVLVKRLHIDPKTNEGSTLIEFSENAPEVILDAPGLIEVFSLSGRFSVDGAGKLSAHSYMCSAAKKASVTISCEQAGELMISHSGELRIRKA